MTNTPGGDPEQSEANRPQVDGLFFLRGEEGFDDAVVDRIFNRREPTHTPAAVLIVETEQDVVAGVKYAKERGWKVAIRSGGHSWAQWSIRDEALVLDLGKLQEVSYDPETQIASASPAVKGGAVLAPYLDKLGRFFPGGHCPTVGIGGFLLQGGQGWNARGWGWAAEWIDAMDVVTADGELVRCSETENADLFWAARGAGPGFFGVVTKYHLRTMPRYGYLAQTIQVLPMSEYEPVFTWLQEMHYAVSNKVEIVVVTQTDPIIDPEPTILVNALAFVDSPEEADEVLAPFRDNPSLDKAILVSDCQETELEVQRQMQLRANPEGHRWAVDNAWLSGSTEDVVKAARKVYTTLPNSKAFTIWFSMAPLRELPDMAFSMQSEIYLASYVLWETEDDDERMEAWLADAMKDLEPVTAGQYLGDGHLGRRQVKFMADENWEKLQRIRAERDPDGLFVGYHAGELGAQNANHWQ